MFEIRFMGGDILEISEEIANKLIGQSGLIALTGIGIINLNSVVSVLPYGILKTKEDQKYKTCKDGTRAIKKFGIWTDQYSGIKLNLSYYPELLEYDNKFIQYSPLKVAGQKNE